MQPFQLAYQEAAIKQFIHKIRIYWPDCDSAGIVFNGNYVKYFETAEEELYRAAGTPRQELLNRLQLALPRVETWARFRKRTNLGDLIAVTTWIEKRTEKSLLYCFEVRRNEEPKVIVEGSYWVTFVTFPQFQAVPVPQEILELLKDYMPPLSQSNRAARTLHPYRDVAP